MDILKIPVGSDEYVAQRLKTKVADMERIMNKLDLIEDAQVEFTMLRACLGACRVLYLLRGAPPGPLVLEVLREADGHMRKTLERLLGCSVPDPAWTQAGLRVSEGGLGLRHALDVAYPAYLGSVMSSSALVAKLLGREEVTLPGVRNVATEYAAALEGDAAASVEPWVKLLQDGPVAEEERVLCPTRPQSMFQKAGDKTMWQRLCSDTSCPLELERLEAERRKRAGSWLACFPNANLGLKMKPQEFVIGVRYWLGLCGQTGFRALLNTGRDQIARHDAIRDVLYETAKACGLSPGREVAVDGSNFRPGDLYIPNWSEGRSLAADVRVSHPSQGNPSLAASGEENASLRAAESAAEAKRIKHGDRCRAQGVTFLPLAVCAFGGWLPEGEEFVDKLAGLLSERTGLAKSVASAQLWQRLSMTLWRSNARALIHHAPPADLGSWDLPGFVSSCGR